MKPTRPLVFYACALFTACLCFVVFKYNVILGAVIAASFLIIIFCTVEKRFSILITCFFILGIFSNHIYYNKISLNKVQSIRIIKKKDFYSLGKIQGRNVTIEGNLSNFQEGDKILAYGKLAYKADYSRGIVGELYIDKGKIFKKDIISKLYDIKRKVYSDFKKYLGEEKSGLLMSLCFGETSYLSQDSKHDFQKLGVIHAISVSGFHMAIIYKLLEQVLGIEVSIFISFLYVIFTGAQPATIRAFIMILVLKLSKKFFKNYDALSSLSLSAITILTFKPFYALDLGFMLSYLSTLGIILYNKIISRALYKLPKNINEDLSLTLSAQTFSMPFAALALGNLSFGFLPGNIILLPVYTVIVVLGNAALLAMSIKTFFAFMCRIIYVVALVLDGAQYILLKIAPPISYMSYIDGIALLGIIISFILVKRKFYKFKIIPIFMLIMVMMQYYSFFPKVEYINYSNINGIVISYKNDRIFLYKGGEDTRSTLGLLNSAFHFTKLIDGDYHEITFRLNKNCSIKAKDANGTFDLEVNSHKFKTIMTTNIQNFRDIDLKNCDIIELPKRNYSSLKYNNFNKNNIERFKIILKRVYSMYSMN